MVGRRRCLLLAMAVAGGAALNVGYSARGHVRRRGALRLQEPPFPLPYDVPELPKPYADYEPDENYPGTLPPGTRRENYPIDEVMEMWEGKENPNWMQARATPRTPRVAHCRGARALAVPARRDHRDPAQTAGGHTVVAREDRAA